MVDYGGSSAGVNAQNSGSPGMPGGDLKDNVGLPDQSVTPEQLEYAANGQRREFWESRLEVNQDPIAQLALDTVDNVGLGYLANERLLAFANFRGISIDPHQVGMRVINAHIEAINLDRSGVHGLLNPQQIAAYHHNVFSEYGLPNTTFGGTPLTGHVYEANVTSLIWCGGCDND